MLLQEHIGILVLLDNQGFDEILNEGCSPNMLRPYSVVAELKIFVELRD